LKESILRLHIRGKGAELPELTIPGALNVRRDGAFAIAVVRDWTSEAHVALERSSSVQIEVEALGLEEIFLELHR
jgi:hypothetical protein